MGDIFYNDKLILKALDFLILEESKLCTKVRPHFKYLVTRKDIEQKIGKKYSKKIIEILIGKGVLIRKPGKSLAKNIKSKVIAAEDYYNMDEGKSYDFYNFIRDKINQEEQIKIQKEQKNILKKQMEIQQEQTDIQRNQIPIQENQTNIQEKQKNIQKWQTFVTIILVLSTIFFGFKTQDITSKQTEIAGFQSNISQKQLEILEKSSQPNEPTLRIWSPDGTLFSYNELRFLNRLEMPAMTRICVKNVGKTETGTINLKWLDGWLYPSREVFHNLLGGETNCTMMELVPDGCIYDKNCSQDEIPDGFRDNVTKINLSIDCGICVPSKHFKEFDLYIKSVKD